MKKTFLALTLCAAASIASAQATQPAPGTSQAEYMNAMLQQLIQLNMTAAQLKPVAPSCSYEDKAYSEGAIRDVGKVTMVCVERDWGVKSFESKTVNALRELVWEPLSSKRIATYREVTGLGSKK